MMLRITKAPLLVSLLAMSSMLSNCVKSVESDVDIMTAPDQDESYAKAFKEYTKKRTVFKDFETRYEVTATYLAPEFRAAFAQRLKQIYKHDDVRFDEATSKAGFFVSLHSPEPARTDLNNPHHWTVMLESGGQNPMRPVIIKKLQDKERWRAFFSTVNEWTQEYLVVFDAPSVTPNSSQLAEKTTIKLIFANADAQVNLSW